MRSLIVYSGTGNTRKEAQELAGMLGADLAEVRCDRYRAGFFGYLRAAYGSVKRRLPAIEFHPTVEQPYDLVLVAGADPGGPPSPADPRVPGHIGAPPIGRSRRWKRSWRRLPRRSWP